MATYTMYNSKDFGDNEFSRLLWDLDAITKCTGSAKGKFIWLGCGKKQVFVRYENEVERDVAYDKLMAGWKRFKENNRKSTERKGA